MNDYLSISTDCPVLHAYLNSGIPEGVKIISEPPRENRGVDLNITVNFDIQFTIDLTKITAYALATWIVKKSLTIKGKHQVNVKEKQISVNDPKAIELLKNELEGTNH